MRKRISDVLDGLSVHEQVERDIIPAEWVVALSRAVGAFQLVKIARAPAVVQDYLLIKIGEVVKHVAALAEAFRRHLSLTWQSVWSAG